MQVPVKKLPMQILLYGLMIVLTLNSVMTKVVELTWFVYVSLGLTALVIVVMIILSKKPDNSLYEPNQKTDKMHSAFLVLFLVFYLLMMMAPKETEATEGLQVILSNNYLLIQWIGASVMLGVSLVGLITKTIEYKKVQSKE